MVFLLRFQALRYCGTATTILAELSGNVAARFIVEGRNRNLGVRDRSGLSKVRGFFALFVGLFLLSMSWYRSECFPLSSMIVDKSGFSLFPRENCVRILPMLLPFLSGFLGCYERVSMNWGTIRQLGRTRVRLISLFFTTVILFFPAVLCILMFEAEGDEFSIASFGWPLANTVIFGVLLTEIYCDEKLVNSRDFQREFLVTFFCTLVLELFYFPELSLWGLLLCGLVLYISVRELDPVFSNSLELGTDSSESLTDSIMKPIRHILSERKSRKIALFLFINTGYMVVEFVSGFMSNSLGLISDACHMLFDCAALAIGLYASYISRLPANSQFNYGRGRFEILSGYVNAVFLVLVGALIVLESIERILEPQEISTNSLLTVSIGGLLVNMVGLIFFHEEHHHAHGGSCSHSHSQLHSHSDHHHHSHACGGHDHTVHVDSQECTSAAQNCLEKSCSSHAKPHTDHESHNSNQHGHSHKCHDQQHDHHNHVRLHDHHDHVHPHDHHDHVHPHDHHHDHVHPHDHHHDHVHPHDHHHDHVHQHDHHHDHVHQHDHHDQVHQHHDHVHRHDHINQHDHHNGVHREDHHDHHHHGHTSIPAISSRNSHSHSLEGHAGGDFHPPGSDPHAHICSLDIRNHSCAEKSDSHLKPCLSSKEEPQKHNHKHIDHNMEGIFLHVLADTMGSVGVVISTLLIKYKGWQVADPACSIFISVLIVSSVIPLLRNSAEILLQRVPRVNELDLKDALKNVMKIRGVCGIQNLHVWSFTNTHVVGTLHLHISTEADKASTKVQVSNILQNAGIKDLTLQVEYVKDT